MHGTIAQHSTAIKTSAYDAIPNTLKDIDRWLVWKYVPSADGKKPKKMPINIHTGRAAQDQGFRDAWVSYDEAVHAAALYEGIGFVFDKATDDIIGVDLDGCIDDAGQLSDQAREIVAALDSYTEVSASGTGLHILVCGRIDRSTKTAGVEIYDDRRYFVMTGDHLDGTPYAINHRQEQLESIVAAVAADKPKLARNSKVPAGGRNNRLASLAGTLRHQGLDQQAIEATLLDYNAKHCEPPLAEGEVLQIARSISRYEPADPAESFPWTDLGNAERLVYYHGHDLRYVNAWGKWLVWDGCRWTEDRTGEVNRRANETVRGMYAAASQVADKMTRKEMAEFARRCESANKLTAMIELAQNLKGVAIHDSQLDADPWVLNLSNGLLDLRTGELQSHDQEALCTKLVPVEYDPRATCPTWLAFLNRVMDGNQELIGFLQQAVGYSLTGATTEQCLFFLYGSGRNGKSTFIETISRLLGDYARRVPTDVLMSGSRGAMTEMSQLQGVRLTLANETEQGARLAESLIKDLTGGDTIVARRLYHHSYEFRPTFKLWMYGNHKPVIKGTDEGIWRRMRLVPFTVQIPVEEVDRQLPAKLLQELPGILNWAIEGCRQWLAAGYLAAPQAVAEATSGYRSEMDPFSDFLGEYVVPGPQMTVKSDLLYGAYQKWCAANGESHVSHKQFGQVLRERGYEARKTGKGTFWQRIGLKDEHRNIPHPLSPHFEDMLSN